MNETVILEYTIQALVLVLVLSLPPIIVASVAGLLMSLIQAITQIQDQTISFAVKLVMVVFTIILTSRWVGGELYNYTERIFDMFPFIVP
ncbi:MAG: type III secretion system export apparatus subunit SctS [Desulfobacterales bacterium]|nr:type III secretion system export apparatus subunit SctS [Desulfobacterales bacterium]